MAVRVRILRYKHPLWVYSVKLQRRVWWGWTTFSHHHSDRELAKCIREAEANMPDLLRGNVLFDSKRDALPSNVSNANAHLPQS